MTIQLVSQIDVNHWTVLFLDGPWKDKTGDYRIELKRPEEGQQFTVEVIPDKKRPEPTTNGYCGILEAKGVVSEPKATKKAK